MKRRTRINYSAAQRTMMWNASSYSSSGQSIVKTHRYAALTEIVIGSGAVLVANVMADLAERQRSTDFKQCK